MRMISKNLCSEAPLDSQVRKAEDAGHLSLKHRGPMCSLKVSKDEREKGRAGKLERMCQCQLYRDQPLKLFFFHLHALNTRLISKHGENKILAAFYRNVCRCSRLVSKKWKFGRNHPAGFAVITVSSTGHDLTPQIMTKFVSHTLAARCNAVPPASANKCFGLAVNCFNQVSKSLFRQQLETWSQLEPGKLFRASQPPSKKKITRSDHERLEVQNRVSGQKGWIYKAGEKEAAALTWL